VCECPCDIILIELRNSLYVVLTQKSIYTDNVCNQEVFQISFPKFVREAKCEKTVHSWQKKNVVLNTVSLKNILHFL
jgi:hypothetical protein